MDESLVDLSKGLEYAAEGNFGEAREEFEKVLRVSPFNSTAIMGRKVIEDIMERKIDRRETLRFFKGLTYAVEGQFDAAISEFTQALEMNPGLAGAYVGRAESYIFKGEYGKAREDVHRAEALGLQTHPVLENLLKAQERQEMVKNPEGKYKVIGRDGYDGEEWVHGEYDTPEEAVRVAEEQTEDGKQSATDAGIATIYYAYDPEGNYLGGNTWKPGEKGRLGK